MKYYAIQQELSPEEIAQKLSAAEEMLQEIRRRKPFTMERQLADEEDNAAKECECRVCFPFTHVLTRSWRGPGSSGRSVEDQQALSKHQPLC